VSAVLQRWVGEVWNLRDSGTEWTLEYCATYWRC